MAQRRKKVPPQRPQKKTKAMKLAAIDRLKASTLRLNHSSPSATAVSSVGGSEDEDADIHIKKKVVG